MSLLTADNIAYMRTTQGETLAQRAIVEHREVIDDGMGGSLPLLTYTPDLPCRVAPMRVQAAESIIGGQLQGGLPWTLTLYAEVALDVSDRVNVGGDLDDTTPPGVVEGGRWFEVIAIYAPWTSETARQCLVIER